MLRRIQLYVVPDEPACVEVQEFLEQYDFHLQIRDVSEKPLNAEELGKLLRHFNLRHFLNESSDQFTKRRLDKFLPSREEVIQLIAEDNDLLRKPIIVAGRLMVVGPNRQKIMEMLQIKSNGSDPSDESESKTK
jgi:arsenate reductase-like glutaredoxin family protein